MSDDLVKRLREYCDGNNDLMDAAADRIEELQKFQSVHAKCDEMSLLVEKKLVDKMASMHRRIKELEEDNERYRRGLIEIVQMERVPMGDERPDYVTKTGTFANDLRNRNWPKWLQNKEDKNGI